MTLLALVVMASPAFAQTDLRPVANQLIDWLSVVLLTGGGVVIAFALRWLASKTKMQDNEFEALLAARLNDILHRAIEHAIVAAKNEVNKPGSGLEAVKFDNLLVGIAVNYALKSMPDIIEYFGLTSERIKEMIMARLGGFLDQVPADGGASAPETVDGIVADVQAAA
jgi:hypothetical protein